MFETQHQCAEAGVSPSGARGRDYCSFGIGVPLIAAGLLWAASALGTTYQVGPTRTCLNVASLPALSPGDIVEIDPATYNEVKRWTAPGTPAKPIVIRGIGASRPIFDATGKTVDGRLPNPRAVFQFEAHNIVIEHLEFRNARNGDNGAGIRVTRADNITVRDCKITACDMGVMCDNNRNLLIEASEIASNGTSLFDGYSHNLYLGGNSATLRFCYIHDSLYGQNFKTRGHYTELICNYIADSQDGEVGMVDAAETAATNSHAVMLGNIVISKPRLSGYNSGRFIQFGQDSGGSHNGTLFAFNNTFIAGDCRIQFLSANTPGATIVAQNNIFWAGDKIIGTTGGGISGAHNWMSATATVPNAFSDTVQGSDPGFLNRLAHNQHLRADSACRDRGLNALVFLDGSGASHSGLPTMEYLNHLQGGPRPTDGKLDLGAYEYTPPKFTGIRLNGEDCILDFTTAAGTPYELQSTSNLALGAWLPLKTHLPGVDGTAEITDSRVANQSQRFYRVKP
jgi:hypothetical protein